MAEQTVAKWKAWTVLMDAPLVPERAGSFQKWCWSVSAPLRTEPLFFSPMPGGCSLFFRRASVASFRQVTALAVFGAVR
jgi:hypothetical protein